MPTKSLEVNRLIISAVGHAEFGRVVVGTTRNQCVAGSLAFRLKVNVTIDMTGHKDHL